jgi:hypothetical protein
MNKFYKAIAFLIIVVSIYLYGALSARKDIFPFPQIEMIKGIFIPNQHAYNDITKKQEVSCDQVKHDRLMVALVIGQSNSANYGELCYAPNKNIYNFYKGKCYKAIDPLLGSDGVGGSVWTMLGDKLIDAGLYENVLFISIGVADSRIARWAPEGDLNHRIIDAINYSKAANFPITHIFWHQGESDARDGTTKAEYKKSFMNMLDSIRQERVGAPIYVSITTRLRNKISNEIREAQAELIDPKNKIYPGPDTDYVDKLDDRHDGVHFSAIGENKVAKLWLRKIISMDPNNGILCINEK